VGFGFVKVILKYFLEEYCWVPVLFDDLCSYESLKLWDGRVSL